MVIIQLVCCLISSSNCTLYRGNLVIGDWNPDKHLVELHKELVRYLLARHSELLLLLSVFFSSAVFVVHCCSLLVLSIFLFSETIGPIRTKLIINVLLSILSRTDVGIFDSAKNMATVTKKNIVVRQKIFTYIYKTVRFSQSLIGEKCAAGWDLFEVNFLF